MRLDIEQHGDMQIHPGLGVWPWLVRHSAWRLARYAVKANGHTAHRDAFSTDYVGEITKFSEVVARRNVSDSGAIQGFGEGRLTKADTPGTEDFGLDVRRALMSTSLATSTGST